MIAKKFKWIHELDEFKNSCDEDDIMDEFKYKTLYDALLIEHKLLKKKLNTKNLDSDI